MTHAELLRGKRVVITRPQQQAEFFAAELKVYGANAILIPSIRLVACNPPNLTEVLNGLSDFDWVVFSSANGVRFFIEAMEKAKVDISSLAARKLATIGPATTEVLADLVRRPDVMPGEYVSEALVRVLGDVNDTKILLVRAVQARKVLGEELSQRGALISELAIYDVENNMELALEQRIRSSEKPDYLTFSSSSCVHGFKQIVEKAGCDWFESVPSICIGPITAATLRDYGVEPFAVAKDYTVAGMIEVLTKKECHVHA